MKALVVRESLCGNTAAVARAIAEGIGPDAQAPTPPDLSGPPLRSWFEALPKGSGRRAWGADRARQMR